MLKPADPLVRSGPRRTRYPEADMRQRISNHHDRRTRIGYTQKPERRRHLPRSEGVSDSQMRDRGLLRSEARNSLGDALLADRSGTFDCLRIAAQALAHSRTVRRKTRQSQIWKKASSFTLISSLFVFTLTLHMTRITHVHRRAIRPYPFRLSHSVGV